MVRTPPWEWTHRHNPKLLMPTKCLRQHWEAGIASTGNNLLTSFYELFPQLTFCYFFNSINTPPSTGTDISWPANPMLNCWSNTTFASVLRSRPQARVKNLLHPFFTSHFPQLTFYFFQFLSLSSFHRNCHISAHKPDPKLATVKRSSDRKHRWEFPLLSFIYRPLLQLTN